MLVALADTHRNTEPALTPHVARTLRDAESLVHAGDFLTEAVYERFEAVADDVVAVYGNSDARSLRTRLPETATVDWHGTRILVTHGHRRDGTSLSLLARQERADVLVTGHTHRPAISRLGEVVHVNPGSHAEPRGNRAAYAAFERDTNGVRVRLRAPTGEDIESERL